ncbi:hypothetical protein [Pseudomonas antarctica]|uniref:hypothetical protein n=1 Tax=Pseudomonas antarctica TaxID=219572 RepID=UPI003F750AEC
MDEEVAGLVVETGSLPRSTGFADTDPPRVTIQSIRGSPKMAGAITVNRGVSYARLDDYGVVTVIQEFPEPPSPESEWKICKENTTVGLPY